MATTHDQPHRSVLFTESIAALDIIPGGRYIDGTLGWAGHSEGILLASSPTGQVLGIDQDPQALTAAAKRLAPYGERAHLVRGNYRDLDALAASIGWDYADGVLLDIGVSSPQLDTAERGFSFQHDGPLDMRMDPNGPQTAADLVNTLDEADLADVIYEYGEERQSRRIARRIVERRRREPFVRTQELAELVASALGGKRGPTHPATRTFQALRIAVNDELGALRDGLAAALRILRPGGRLAVITFHSLEDRIVKQWMRDEAAECRLPPKLEPLACQHLVPSDATGPRPCVFPFQRSCDYIPQLNLTTKKPIEASISERDDNPRARSAKLRIAEKR